MCDSFGAIAGSTVALQSHLSSSDQYTARVLLSLLLVVIARSLCPFQRRSAYELLLTYLSQT
ncbi:MAG: hypothetical protein RLP02_21655 [Coleofasciculus sp. C2-GNP5-27]